MKSFRISLFLILLSQLFVGCAANNAKVAEQLIGKHTPYTRFTMLDGDLKSMEEYMGKPTVVVFWALWCNKSRRALNKINAFAAPYVAHGTANFIAANIDKAEKFQELKERLQFTHLTSFVHAFSGNEVYDEAYQSFGGGSLPFIVVIDKNGTVVSASNDDKPVYQMFGVNPDSVPEVNDP